MVPTPAAGPQPIKVWEKGAEGLHIFSDPKPVYKMVFPTLTLNTYEFETLPTKTEQVC